MINHRDIVVGTRLVMDWRSQKGKQRLKQHGLEWEVAAKLQNVQYEKKKPGPFILIFPLSGWNEKKIASEVSHLDNSRWVNVKYDNDFRVREIL